MNRCAHHMGSGTHKGFKIEEVVHGMRVCTFATPLITRSGSGLPAQVARHNGRIYCAEADLAAGTKRLRPGSWVEFKLYVRHRGVVLFEECCKWFAAFRRVPPSNY